MVYDWKKGAVHKVSAQVAGEVCAELEARGELNAENLVEISKPEDAPLHDEFEWNDRIAAEKYRNVQASAILRHLVINREDKEPVRAYIQVVTRQSNYESIQVIVENADKHEALLKQALRELDWFKKKYSILSELKPVLDAIDSLEE